MLGGAGVGVGAGAGAGAGACAGAGAGAGAVEGVGVGAGAGAGALPETEGAILPNCGAEQVAVKSPIHCEPEQEEVEVSLVYTIYLGIRNLNLSHFLCSPYFLESRFENHLLCTLS